MHRKTNSIKREERPTTALASKDESFGVTLNGTVLGSVISEVRLKAQEIQ